MSANSLSKRVAVVTGASAGIGAAVVRELVSEGAYVVANARREKRLQELAAELNVEEKRVTAVCGDASKEAVIEEMLDTARELFGTEANLVVLNAGRGLLGSLLTSDKSQWEEVVQTNYVGVLRMMRTAALRMTEDAEREEWPGQSRDIFVIGSTVGRNISPFSSMYGSTKAAVHSLTESVRREIGPKGVRVTLIEPGIVASEFQGVAGYDEAWATNFKDRVGPVLEPADIARSIAFAASQPSHVHIADMLLRPTRQDYP